MIHLTVIAAVRSTLLLVVTIGLQGCAVLPEPGEEDVFINTDLIATVRIGQTNKAELRKEFGPPDWHLSDGSRWIYRTRDYRPFGFFVLSEGPGGSLAKWRTEFLYLTFDSSDLIDKVEISSTQPDPDDGWSKRDISDACVEAYGMPLIYGSADEDANAKHFQVRPGQCAVYLYTATTSLPFFVSIIRRKTRDSSGYQTRVRCPANDGYLRIDLKPGLGRIAVVSDDKFETGQFSQTPIEEKAFSGAIDIECKQSNVYFMREYFGGGDSFSFEIVSEEEGRREIAERRLVLGQKLRFRSSREQSAQ
jgi:hypothetical protein